MRARTAVMLATLVAAAPLAAADYRATAPDPAAQFATLLDLYGALCLDAFPDDGAVAAAVAARGGVSLDAAGLRGVLHDDPGEGWRVRAAGADYIVTIEYPPFHACAVRTMTARGFPGLAPYRRLLDRYEAGRGRYVRHAPIAMTVEGIASTLRAESGTTADGATDNLIDAENRIADPAVRAAGHDAVEVRFVHQIVRPAIPGGS